MALASYAVQEEFREDLDEIVSSKPFRRMSNKSQIMVKPTRDHFRSRLIHTAEVNQIAVAIGSQLDLNTQLISAIALSHDIGHTPFAHAGERTIQEILFKELVSSFGIGQQKLTDQRKLFHHASNSARILRSKFKSVKKVTVAGVLTHSWSPWATKELSRPSTYEAQVVAIADQLASINHDTEDIIEGAPYTNYDYGHFEHDLKRWLSEKKVRDYRSKVGDFLKSNGDDGFGRKERVLKLINIVVEGAHNVFHGSQVETSASASEWPIAIQSDWGAFLQAYERFIREGIVQRESWFVGRDAIAKALVSTVFNHIWPRCKSGKTIQIDLWPRKVQTKSAAIEESQSIDHYSDFYEDDYGDKSAIPYLQELAQEDDLETWDIHIAKQATKILRTKADSLLRLISVIDFVAGLTDRYCLEIFDKVYQNFSI